MCDFPIQHSKEESIPHVYLDHELRHDQVTGLIPSGVIEKTLLMEMLEPNVRPVFCISMSLISMFIC